MMGWVFKHVQKIYPAILWSYSLQGVQKEELGETCLSNFSGILRALCCTPTVLERYGRYLLQNLLEMVNEQLSRIP